MIPELSWFAMGAVFGLVLCGWPWHPRFSRYSCRRITTCGGGEITRAEWESMRTRRGSNPPPPGTKPQPPGGPPQPLAAQLIRYWTWEDDQIRQAFNEGRTIRGNRSGGPTTPKPEIVPKPQPPGGRLIGPDGVPIGYRPGNNPPPREP